MLRTIFQVLLGLCLFAYPSTVTPQKLEARKFDEFGDEELSSIAARLDNFAIQLQNEPQMKAFVIAYRARRDLPGLSSSLASWLRNYLIQNRGFATDRIIALDGGAAGCVSQELWLVPPGAAPAIRADAYPRNYEDIDSPRKFYEASYYAPNFANESYSFDIKNSFEGFADALRRQPKSLAYLIAYAGYRIQNESEINAESGKIIRRRDKVFIQPVADARMRLQTYVGVLAKEYKIPKTRIRTIFGGYRDWPTMELWIVPRNRRPPIPTPDIFPKVRR